MASKKHGTKIEWTHSEDRKGETWNPWVGCTPTSAACQNCYAARMANRFKNKVPHYKGVATAKGWTGQINRASNKQFYAPRGWRGPRRIFVCSMSDFFHEGADEWRQWAWHTIYDTPQHTYLILTKRPERIASHLSDFGKKEWPWPHVQLGVTVENREEKWRIGALQTVPAALRWLSLEPLLEDLGKLNLDGISWVVCGGQTGPGARPCHPDWIRSIRNQCQAAGVPFFFKGFGEWGPSPYGYPLCGSPRCITIWPDGHIGSGDSYLNKGVYEHMHRLGKKRAGRLLDGKEYNEMP